MAVKVVLTNKSQQTHALTTPSTASDNDVQMGRTVYQYLRSLVRNKGILDDYNNDRLPREFKNFLDSLDKKMQGEEVSDALNNLDEYLGSLGIESIYSFSKDMVNVEAWLDCMGQDNIRNVVTDESENVVVDVAGTTYNVIHERQE